MSKKTLIISSHITTALFVIATIVLLIFTAIHNIWIFVFFWIHWYVSVFMQSFFLHRYAAHAMFTTSKFWERVFHFFTWVAQWPSYLVPSAYAVLHRLHHKFSDTIDDPHSPIFFKDIIGLMVRTRKIYVDIMRKALHVDQFAKNYPVWKWLDAWGQSWTSRVFWWLLYIGIYYALGASRWMYFLLPIHFTMGAVHGAIVNWAGHMIGYINHKLDDHSKNTLPLEILTVGELFQNNHHNNWSNPNFANKRWEFDPTYAIMKVLAWLRIIRFTWTPK